MSSTANPLLWLATLSVNSFLTTVSISALAGMLLPLYSALIMGKSNRWQTPMLITSKKSPCILWMRGLFLDVMSIGVCH
ncbi:hypothetical protein, partial [Pseudomonas chlororaphis]|uniref:hypothetical protein n=1 Tax=Pseudomonas chlororaphis TaxID=587753 RepID=UPI001B32DF7F